MTPYSPMSCEMSEKTTRYCWSTYLHATRLWLLIRIHQVLGPATMAYARHNFRHFGVDQQYPNLCCDSTFLSQTNTFGFFEGFGLLTARRVRDIRSASSWRPAGADNRQRGKLPENPANSAVSGQNDITMKQRPSK